MSDVDYSPLPEHLREGARRYVEHGVSPGSFLSSVFENDFARAAIRADDRCALALPDIARWLINEAPDACWGSRAKVLDWICAANLRAANTEEARG